MRFRLPVTLVLSAVVLAAALLPACSSKDAGSQNEDMNISVTLRDMNRCSRLSPEIIVTGIPAGTEYFDVRLLEHNAEERIFGGGTWNNDNSGIIPEGTLTRHYRGPCPPAGQSRDYSFVVSAMRKGDIQPLAVRLYRFTQE